MKKVGAILLAAAMSVTMVAAFAACGSGDDGDTATTKTVKVWSNKSLTEDEGKTYKALEELFNEADYKTQDGRDIVMRIEYKGEQIDQAISSENAMGGAGLPDVFAIDCSSVAMYVNNGYVVPIDDYIAADVKADYVDSTIEQGTYNGKLYALFGADAPAGLFYNKELLSSVGITPGTIENPWDWDDLENAITTLKSAGKAHQIQLSLNFGTEGPMYMHTPIVYSAGGDFADATGKVTASLTSTESLAGLNKFADFMKEGKANGWFYTGTNENAFPQELIAFQIFGPWLVRTINKNFKSFTDKYDVMPYPVYNDEDGKSGIATPCGSWGFAVSKTAKDQDAAAQVVTFLTSATASELLFDSIGTFPTHKSYLSETEEFKSGALKSLSDLLTETAHPRPKLTNYTKLRDAYRTIINYIDVNVADSAFSQDSLLSTIKSAAATVDG